MKKKHIKLICNHCNGIFFVIRSRKKSAKYCSRQCRDIKNRKIAGEIHPFWSGPGLIEKVCLKCEKKFFARHDRPGKYCSRPCRAKSIRKKITRVTLFCQWCEKLYEVKKHRKFISKFCSRSCLATARGKKITGENHPFWKGGISKRTWKDQKLIIELKKQIGKCENCGNKEDLEGHHINGYRKDKQSVKILCSECHAKEHPKISRFIKAKYGKRGILDQRSH